MENLATENVDIQHSPTAKRFLRMNIEEFIVSSNLSLATGNCFIVLINYIADFGFTHQATKNNQLMFYVMHSVKPNDMDADAYAREITERVAEDILLRMQYDSQNNNAQNIFENGFDRINARMVPAEKRTASGNYVGFQVSIKLPEFFSRCYNPAKWTTP